MIEAVCSLSPSGPWLISAASSAAVSCPSLRLHHRHFRHSKKTFQVSSIHPLTAYQQVAPPSSSSALTTPTRHKWRWPPVPEAQVIEQHLPIRVGVVFSGRQSPGGHNVVWGIYDAMKAHNPQSVLLGFVGGTGGLFAKKTFEITDDVLSSYKNQGGFDLLGRTVDQIRTTEQVNAAMSTCCDLKLDGLVIIGGIMCFLMLSYLEG